MGAVDLAEGARDRGESAADLGARSTAPIAADWHDGQSEKFFQSELDRVNQLDPVRQISFGAHR
jgi:hypothetical protein